MNMVSYNLSKHSKAVKAILQETHGKKDKISYFVTPVWPIYQFDQWVDVTGYIDSPHKVSQYLLIHSKALKAGIK